MSQPSQSTQHTGRLTGVLKSIAWPVSLLLGLCVLTFFLSHVAPGDPARIILGPSAREDVVQALRAEMGLDQPVWRQFARFMGDTVTGNWGASWLTRQPVLREIGDHLPPTLWLGFFASLYSMGLALAINALAYAWPGLGKLLIPSLRLGIAIPAFVFAVAAALATIRLETATGWSAGQQSAARFLLPALAVALYPACVMAALVRDRFSAIMASPFYRAARAAGQPPPLIFLQTLLANSWPTLLIAWVNQISMLVFSTIIVEWVFSFRGIGTLLIRSIQGKDLPVLSGIILLNGVFFLLIRMLARESSPSRRAAADPASLPPFPSAN
jgi:glutathione transport system permease protein